MIDTQLITDSPAPDACLAHPASTSWPTASGGARPGTLPRHLARRRLRRGLEGFTGFAVAARLRMRMDALRHHRDRGPDRPRSAGGAPVGAAEPHGSWSDEPSFPARKSLCITELPTIPSQRNTANPATTNRRKEQ